MLNLNTYKFRPTPRDALYAACAVAAVLLASPPQANHGKIRAPLVPATIEVPAGHKAFLKGQAVGTQNYVCLPSGATFVWTLSTPQATLFNGGGDRQVITHFFSPNPDEPNTDPRVKADGMIRPVWQHSRDGSAVWAKAFPPSFDPNFVAPGAVPWLLLEIVGTQDGADGGDKLTETKYIQRVNTGGGIAPSTGCTSWTDVGSRVFVPYVADYFFFKLDDDNN